MSQNDKVPAEQNSKKISSSIENKILESKLIRKEKSRKAKIYLAISLILTVIIIYFIFFYTHCGSGKYMYDGECIPMVYCFDDTLSPQCSVNKPYRCIDGELIKSASVCGCPDGYSIDENSCTQTPTCDDGTYYNSCSQLKPLFCEDGILINKSSVCGCPTFGNYESFNDVCIPMNQKSPVTKEIFFQRYTNYEFSLTMHTDMFDFYQDKEHFDNTYKRTLSDNWRQDFYTTIVNDQNGDYIIDSIIHKINTFSDVDDTKIELMTALVQHINNTNTTDSEIQYPYETLYLQNGTDTDKAILLAKLIKRAGYGTAIFDFKDEDHSAVGIKCPPQYTSLNTSYCYIETTIPNMIGNVPRIYEIGIELKSTPVVITISEGSVFEKVETYPSFMLN